MEMATPLWSLCLSWASLSPTVLLDTSLLVSTALLLLLETTGGSVNVVGALPTVTLTPGAQAAAYALVHLRATLRGCAKLQLDLDRAIQRRSRS